MGDRRGAVEATGRLIERLGLLEEHRHRPVLACGNQHGGVDPPIGDLEAEGGD